VLLRLAEAVLACPGIKEYAAYLPELVSCVFHLCALLVVIWVFLCVVLLQLAEAVLACSGCVEYACLTLQAVPELVMCHLTV
jgi:hypothetical protein